MLVAGCGLQFGTTRCCEICWGCYWGLISEAITVRSWADGCRLRNEWIIKAWDGCTAETGDRAPVVSSYRVGIATSLEPFGYDRVETSPVVPS